MLTRIGLQISLHERLKADTRDTSEKPRAAHLLLESEDGFGTTDEATAATTACARQIEVGVPSAHWVLIHAKILVGQWLEELQR